MVDRYAGRGRHAEAEEIYAAEEVHTEARQAEGGASERARAHGGGLGGLSGTDYQMPAGASNRAAKRQSLAQPRQPAFSHTLVFDLDQPTGQLFTTTLSSA